LQDHSRLGGPAFFYKDMSITGRYHLELDNKISIGVLPPRKEIVKLGGWTYNIFVNGKKHYGFFGVNPNSLKPHLRENINITNASRINKLAMSQTQCHYSTNLEEYVL